MVVVVVDVLRTSISEESEISTTLKTRIVKNKKVENFLYKVDASIMLWGSDLIFQK